MKKVLIMVISLLLASTMLVSCAIPTTTAAPTTAETTAAAAASAKVTFIYSITELGSVTADLPIGTPIASAVAQAVSESMSSTFKAPSKAQYGYSFVGWYTDAAYTQAIDKTGLINNDTTFYAKWDAWDDATKAKLEPYFAEMALAKNIILGSSMYEKAGFDQYFMMVNGRGIRTIDKAQAWKMVTPELVTELKAAREALVEVKSKDEVWYDIWGKAMPAAPDAADYNYFLQLDNEGFRPMMAAYLLDDQTAAKGNIIVIAGGGYQTRENVSEGFPVCEFFNSIGYNAFLLQRRVAPSQPVDSGLDLQRAIRYLRFNAAAKGIGGIDHIGAIGFSGGGMTICQSLTTLYGDVQPTTVYADYVPDAVDAVNSDLNAALLVYGAVSPLSVNGVFPPFETTNPNLPSTFIAAGADDAGFAVTSPEVFAFLNSKKVPVELHIYASIGHAFGMGFDYVGSDQMGAQIDAFLDVEFGYTPRLKVG